MTESSNTSDTAQLGSEPVREALEAAEQQLMDLARPICCVYNRATRRYDFTDEHIAQALPGTFDTIKKIRAALASQQGGEKVYGSGGDGTFNEAEPDDEIVIRSREVGGEKAEASAQEPKGKLLGCPFCGGQPVSKWYSGGEGLDDCGYWGIDCCGAFCHQDDEETAVRVWNTRIAPASRSPAAIAPAVWNDGYQADAVKLAATIQSQRHKDFTPEYQEKLLLADALMQALGVVETLKGYLEEFTPDTITGCDCDLCMRANEVRTVMATISSTDLHPDPEDDRLNDAAARGEHILGVTK